MYSEIKELLQYEPETGKFTWTQSRGTRKKGSEAGTFHKQSGYFRIKVNNKVYQAHRLAWLLTYGDFPKEDIDHINGVRSDNRLINLREATRAQNALNRKKANKDNLIKVRNVRLHEGGKYQVRLNIGGRTKSIGVFDELELAELVAEEAREKYYGEFA